MKYSDKINSIFGSIFLILVLGLMMHITGCSHHKNPLLTTKKSEAVSFLLKAQEYASKKENLYYSMDSVYITCVKTPKRFDNPLNPDAQNPCENYLKTMVSYANHSKKFRGLTVNDLKDPKTIQEFSKPLFDAML